MTFTRNNYRVKEKFVHPDSGFEYLKVEWKGIGAEGHLRRLKGEGKTIDEEEYQDAKDDWESDGPNVRVGGVIRTETNNTKAGDKTGFEAEVSGVFPVDVAPTQDEIQDILEGLADEAQGQLTFVGRDDINLYERERTREDAVGWDTDTEAEIAIENDQITETYDYNVHPDQKHIEDF